MNEYINNETLFKQYNDNKQKYFHTLVTNFFFL